MSDVHYAGCVVCGGTLSNPTHREYDPMTGPPIIGPGSRAQFRTVSSGIRCDDCGLRYAAAPKKEVLDRLRPAPKGIW